MNGEKTAVVLLIYDRPEHTSAVLEGLRQNAIDELLVFADAPATEADEDGVQATRAVVDDVSWCDVEMIERDENLGLKENWIDAYETVFEEYERAIVFEDDCVPSADCVSFMKACLDEYADEPRVMNVHGYSPPISLPDGYRSDVYFTYRSGSWGQATWRNAWDKFEQDHTEFELISNSPALRRKLDRAGDDLYRMFRREIDGELDSVGIWWTWTIIKHDGVSVNPVESRVFNIGHDGTGTHSDETDRFDTRVTSNHQDEISFPDAVEVNKTINRRYCDFLTTDTKPLPRRIVSKLSTVLK